MKHFFELPVSYKGEERSFKGRLVTFGYSYKFYIMVNGEELVFEKDDSGEYRVLTDKPLKVDNHLLVEIVETLQKLNQQD